MDSNQLVILTYKDIDSAGEKLQLGAMKIFSEFEQLLIEKIKLLSKLGFQQIHLVSDHGFVLTGLLDESTKIEPTVVGKKEVNERYIRTSDKQQDSDWLCFEEPYMEYNYIYVSKSDKPFRSKGVYGFSHGGFTPQEIIIPHLVISPKKASAKRLNVTIQNKAALREVTGEYFTVKLSGESSSGGSLFESFRNVTLKAFASNKEITKSGNLSIDAGATTQLELGFSGHSSITLILLDSESSEQLDSVTVNKSTVRDLGGLF
jgi:hypothetical protein